jgi:hypothetical protein
LLVTPTSRLPERNSDEVSNPNPGIHQQHAYRRGRRHGGGVRPHGLLIAVVIIGAVGLIGTYLNAKFGIVSDKIVP